MTRELRQLADRAHHHDMPIFLQTCVARGGYPEPPAQPAGPAADQGDLHNLDPWAKRAGEGRG